MIINGDTQEKLKRLVNKEDRIDSYVLDDENAIIVKYNRGRRKNEAQFLVIHKRLVFGKLNTIKKWYLNKYEFGSTHFDSILEKEGLFKIQCGMGYFNGLYDYKNGKFVISPFKWGMLYFGTNNSFLEKYQGVLGEFKIKSDYDYDDFVSYVNALTEEKMHEDFNVEDGNYYALINLDGTIRGNKLFKGTEFSKIEEIIDLDNYKSLDDFKEKRKQRCNDLKKLKKELYQRKIKERENDSISPYLDEEVKEIITLKQD